MRRSAGAWLSALARDRALVVLSARALPSEGAPLLWRPLLPGMQQTGPVVLSPPRPGLPCESLDRTYTGVGGTELLGVATDIKTRRRSWRPSLPPSCLLPLP